MTRKELAELAAAYALGTLDADEQAAFERALEDDPSLRAEVGSYESVVAGLQLTVAPMEPPPHLRTRVLDRARTEAATGSEPTADVIPLPRKTPGRVGRVVPWAAAAALVAGLGLWQVYASVAADRDGWRERYEALATDLEVLRAANMQQAELLAVFAGPDLHSVSLAAPEAAPQVRVFWNHPDNLFLVTAFGLPPAPEGQTYQLWALADGASPLSMGTFNTDGDQRATIRLPVSQAIAAIDFVRGCGLTLEPDGGSASPTGEVRLLGEWRHAE